MASQGPNSPQYGTNVLLDGEAWLTPSNILSSNDSRATVALSTNQSDYIYASGFNFTIPDGATINGILCGVERSKTGAGQIQDSTVELLVGGIRTGDNKASGSVNWPLNTDSNQLYGGENDSWGVSLSSTQVNNSMFGFSLSATTASTATARIDYMSVLVYYTEAGSGIQLVQNNLNLVDNNIFRGIARSISRRF